MADIININGEKIKDELFRDKKAKSFISNQAKVEIKAN
jgi:hypothetical protein